MSRRQLSRAAAFAIVVVTLGVVADARAGTGASGRAAIAGPAGGSAIASWATRTRRLVRRPGVVRTTAVTAMAALALTVSGGHGAAPVHAAAPHAVVAAAADGHGPVHQVRVRGITQRWIDRYVTLPGDTKDLRQILNFIGFANNQGSRQSITVYEVSDGIRAALDANNGYLVRGGTALLHGMGYSYLTPP